MYTTDEKEKAESKPLEKIQMKHLILAFLILGIGCCVALIVFLLEKCCKQKKFKVEHQASSRENLNLESYSDH
jgi:hypothetical protein